MAERDLDILIYGATGFVGRQCVRYLAASSAARGLRIGLGGRDRAKLEAVRERGGAGGAEIVVADSGIKPRATPPCGARGSCWRLPARSPGTVRRSSMRASALAPTTWTSRARRGGSSR